MKYHLEGFLFQRKVFILATPKAIANNRYEVFYFHIDMVMDSWVLKTIRMVRIEKNYSQDFMAMKLNMSQSYYGRIENGKATLTFKTFCQILHVLDVDYLDFFVKIKEQERKKAGQC
ncbi:MAG: hypothetical protein CFE23_14890 [Flavobacterium sp. BFFFF1]|uniref:helix-turn-helix domain-containing protein n=1 Tax=Flavobacterium sp. BFFFF1 TaxID=2015557 RepID=UPI000BD7BA5C|nr:helix-turn-helix transcriptional regulator [Flavobacterium sp. BFFFF1]OYU79271.1 MAG: hypothetical protein CFE23_14890 [Flavobacterium sp. BFFFF1]